MTWFVRSFRLHAALWLGLGVLAVAVMTTPAAWDWQMRVAVAWDASASVFLVLTLARLRRARTADAIRRRAAALDQAGAAVLPLSLLAAAASVFVIVVETADGGKPTTAEALFSIGTIAVSWLFTHVIFALHYAHGYYAPDEDGADREGLIFPGETAPDDWDFLHFALVIGVAAQTADVQIASKRLRRLSTVHSLMAFLFNTVILALAVNMAVNLL